jgi:phosphoribosylanthranilate isomerase
MRVKICGITQSSQAQAIASLGVDSLGFICVPSSPRYLPPEQITLILAQLPPTLKTIGVFAQAQPEVVIDTVQKTGLTGIQLHGDESPEYTHQLRRQLPQVELIKALRLKEVSDLAQLSTYYDCIDTILLDAYHPQLLGGTSKTLAWESLQNFSPPRPWLLAGGLNPDNISQALEQVHPDGLDISSGVEQQPGIKDLAKVKQFLTVVSLQINPPLH